MNGKHEGTSGLQRGVVGSNPTDRVQKAPDVPLTCGYGLEEGSEMGNSRLTH